MRMWHRVYWFITGALLGLGLFLLGLPAWDRILWLAGFILVIIGLFALRGRELVAAVLGFGIVPETTLAAFLATWKFPPDVPPVYPLIVTLDVLVFGVITVVGLVALVMVWRTAKRVSEPVLP